MFTAVASAILWAKRAWDRVHAAGVTVDSVRTVYEAAMRMKAEIAAGRESITSDDGVPMAPGEFVAAFDAFERAQVAGGIEAGARQDRRHAADGTGTP